MQVQTEICIKVIPSYGISLVGAFAGKLHLESCFQLKGIEGSAQISSQIQSAVMLFVKKEMNCSCT